MYNQLCIPSILYQCKQGLHTSSYLLVVYFVQFMFIYNLLTKTNIIGRHVTML